MADKVSDVADPDVAGDDNGRFQQVLGEIGEVATRVVEELGSGLGNAEDSLRTGLGRAEETVRKHPLAALGVAAGVGFLIGVLMTRGGRGEE